MVNSKLKPKDIQAVLCGQYYSITSEEAKGWFKDSGYDVL